jgi:hypothetical protein
MRRFRLAALMGTTAMGTAALVCLTSAVPAVAHAKPKPAFKVGTYQAKSSGSLYSITPPKFNITLKRAKCGKASGLCVSLPVMPSIECKGAVTSADALGNFATAVALPPSGNLTQRMAVTGAPVVPGAGPSPGQSTFSVAFTKKGTASGYFELNLTFNVQGTSIPCVSGKVPFTAKLG